MQMKLLMAYASLMTRPSHSINITDKSANTTITGIGNRIFTGNEIKQTGIVVTVCGKKLSLGSNDYTLKYQNNKNIGRQVILWKGNYYLGNFKIF